jgi:hypothetical protein
MVIINEATCSYTNNRYGSGLEPNKEHCDRYCSCKDADWRCYHHSMLCHGTSKEQLLAEVEQLKQSINSELLEIERRSKIKYYSNPSQCLQHKFNKSIYFQPTHSNEFIFSQHIQTKKNSLFHC